MKITFLKINRTNNILFVYLQKTANQIEFTSTDVGIIIYLYN